MSAMSRLSVEISEIVDAIDRLPSFARQVVLDQIEPFDEAEYLESDEFRAEYEAWLDERGAELDADADYYNHRYAA